jgi:hypothetical protein
MGWGFGGKVRERSRGLAAGCTESRPFGHLFAALRTTSHRHGIPLQVEEAMFFLLGSM